MQRLLGASVPPAALCAPGRVQALHETGLTAEPDPVMDRFAQQVRGWVGVPVALVSLVSPEEQTFPGMVGLPEPWATTRSTPLTYSFCQHVVASAEPLVIEDARTHALGHDPESGVVAYAGMPLTDEAGHVLGALCALDTEPRPWTPVELDMLRLLADGATTELRLRLARFVARAESERRDRLEDRLRRSVDRSQTMLNAAEAFSDTATADDVRDRIRELVSTELDPSHVGLSLLGADQLMHRVRDPRIPGDVEDSGRWRSYDVAARLPTATATRTGRVVAYADRDAYDADHPEEARQVLRDLGIHAIVAVPLPHADGWSGALALAWDAPHRLEPADLLLLTTIAHYTAQALGRARLLAHRDSAAHQLQHAMLTRLPAVPGLTMAARYRPADSREHVGGDWFDAIPVPDPYDPDKHVLAVTVGDVTGHTLAAAAVMGQVRAMLRQAAWDHPGEPPSVTLTAFERTAAGIDLPATGSAVLVHLEPRDDRRWSMTWTNAGHPPPVLLTPGGPAALLDGHDLLFGYSDLDDRVRGDLHCVLAPGSTLVLYTDGLVERRGSEIDAGTEQLLTLLEDQRDRAPDDLVDVLVETLAADSTDDVVVLVVRVPGG